MNNLHIFQSEKEFTDTVVHVIYSEIIKKTRGGGTFRLALSGGSTPGPIYRRLAEQKIPWEQVEVYLVDERYVPLDDKNSNYRMIREALLDKMPSSPKKVIYFDTSLSIEESLKYYESQLDPSQSEFFDLVVLGMGTDGHTASLFPKSPALEENKRWVSHATTDQFDIRDRLTLTFPALESASQIFLIARGKEKEAVLLKQNLSLRDDFPAFRIIKMKKTRVFLSI